MAKNGIYNVLNTTTGQYEEYYLKTSVAQVEGLPQKINEFETEISTLSTQKFDKRAGALSGNLISRNVDDSYLQIAGGSTTANGATLVLRGKDGGADDSKGEFNLVVRDGTNTRYLIGKPTGTLTWNGKEVERVNASGSNYIRLDSGLQICWGGVNASTSGVNVNFPQAFNANPSVFTSPNGYTVTTGAVNVTTKSVSLTANASAYVKYLAIGWWK